MELPATVFAATNVLAVKYPLHIYQLFFGISPVSCRVFFGYPRGTDINELDVGIHLPTYAGFGFVDGWESPIEMPSPRSQIILTDGPLISVGFYNPLPYNINPLLRILVNRLNVSVVTDPDLIQKILERRVECTLATMGGIDQPYKSTKAQYQSLWGVKPIPLGATAQQIKNAVSGGA